MADGTNDPQNSVTEAVPEAEAAEASRSLPLADGSRSWDGGEARKRIREWAGDNIGKARKAFLVAEGNNISDFKFPIADVIDGELKAVPAGIYAAAAALGGARTPTTASESSQSSARSTLAAYYKRLGKTPPWEQSSSESAVDGEATEVKGSSMGGESPKGDIKPERQLVDSFGKWAKGKQHICVRVLLTKHPELFAGRKGGDINKAANALCAWMKDQWAHTTKWRNKGASAEKKVVRAAQRAAEGESDDANSLFPEEWTRALPEGWTDEQLTAIAQAFDAERDAANEVIEAAISFERTKDELRQAISAYYRTGGGKDPYCYIVETYDDSVIYRCDAIPGEDISGYGSADSTYKIGYRINEDGSIALQGQPIEVVTQYVPVDNGEAKLIFLEVDQDESDEPHIDATESGEVVTELTAEKLAALIDAAIGRSIAQAQATREAEEAKKSESSGPQWKKTKKGVAVLVHKGKVLKPEKMKGLSYSKMMGDSSEAKADAYDNIQSAPGNPGERMGSDKEYVTIMQPKGNVSVLMDKKTGVIVKGPRHLRGKMLPPMPASMINSMESTSASPVESRIGAPVDDDGILIEAAEATFTEEWILTPENMEVAEATGVKTKTEAPSGKKYDAIIRIIRSGPGNSLTRFYYTAESLSNGSLKTAYEGKKMYSNHETPEQEQRRGPRPRPIEEWVATLKEVWESDGAGYGGVDFVDEAFEKKARRGWQDMGVSIRGRLRAKPGVVNGERYNVVESFTTGRSVDFVTEPGAGGGFVSIS
jgi:hypothetical protein